MKPLIQTFSGRLPASVTRARGAGPGWSRVAYFTVLIGQCRVADGPQHVARLEPAPQCKGAEVTIAATHALASGFERGVMQRGRSATVVGVRVHLGDLFTDSASGRLGAVT